MSKAKKKRNMEESDDSDEPIINKIMKKRKKSDNSESKKMKSVESTKNGTKKSAKVKQELSVGDDKFASKPGKLVEPRKLKEMEKTARLSHAMQAFLWWDAPEHADGQQWVTMEHAGVSFPEPYVPHKVKMKYDGKPVDLNPVEEEAATFFAAMDPEGMHLGNPKTADIFIKNFFLDFKAILGKSHIIKDFKKCDFAPIRDHLNEKKIVKKSCHRRREKAKQSGTRGIHVSVRLCHSRWPY